MESKKGGANAGAAALLSVACGIVSSRFLPAAILLPVVGIYYGVMKTWHWAAAVFLTALIAANVAAGMWTMLVLGTFALPVMAAGIYVLRRKWNAFESVAFCIGAVFTGLMLGYALANALAGGDALGSGMDAFGRYLVSLPQDAYRTVVPLFSASMALNVDVSGEKAQVVAYLTGQAEAMIRSMLPVLVLVYSALGGLFCFAFSRKRLQVAGGDVVPMVPFWDYQLPARFARGAVFIIAIGLIVQFLSDGWLAQVGILTNTLFLVCFVVQGFAVVDYYLVHRSMPRVLRWLVMAVLYALIGSVMFVVGVMDQVLGIRSRIAA